MIYLWKLDVDYAGDFYRSAINYYEPVSSRLPWRTKKRLGSTDLRFLNVPPPDDHMWDRPLDYLFREETGWGLDDPKIIAFLDHVVDVLSIRQRFMHLTHAEKDLLKILYESLQIEFEQLTAYDEKRIRPSLRAAVEGAR